GSRVAFEWHETNRHRYGHRRRRHGIPRALRGQDQNRRGIGTRAVTAAAPLRTVVSNLEFQNPIVLAAGTAGYGEELTGVMRPERLGGLVTKAVSLQPRPGAPAPRVTEFPGGMVNAIGLGNTGIEGGREGQRAWVASHAGGGGRRAE